MFIDIIYIWINVLIIKDIKQDFRMHILKEFPNPVEKHSYLRFILLNMQITSFLIKITAHCFWGFPPLFSFSLFFRSVWKHILATPHWGGVRSPWAWWIYWRWHGGNRRNRKITPHVGVGLAIGRWRVVACRTGFSSCSLLSVFELKPERKANILAVIETQIYVFLYKLLINGGL